jgi:hypothetical protein
MRSIREIISAFLPAVSGLRGFMAADMEAHWLALFPGQIG